MVAMAVAAWTMVEFLAAVPLISSGCFLPAGNGWQRLRKSLGRVLTGWRRRRNEFTGDRQLFVLHNHSSSNYLVECCLA